MLTESAMLHRVQAAADADLKAQKIIQILIYILPGIICAVIQFFLSYIKKYF